jgi:hypothetical protein
VRLLLPFALAFALIACGAPNDAPRCDLSASHEISFTAPDVRDVVETRSIGSDCSAAVAVIIVRSHEGLPLWAWAAPAYPTFGDTFVPRGPSQGPAQDDMRAFLARWAAPELARTSAAPVWNAALQTTLDRATYEDIRARNLPMLCHLAGVARYMCVYWEPGVAGAGELYVRDSPSETEPTNAAAEARGSARPHAPEPVGPPPTEPSVEQQSRPR